MRIRNFLREPSRLGQRHVEILVVINVPHDTIERKVIPHVCELRLETVEHYMAREKARPHLEHFYERFSAILVQDPISKGTVKHLAQWTLTEPHERKSARMFRRKFGSTFGSTISGWRQCFGCKRYLAFDQLRKACMFLSLGDHVVDIWVSLDSGLGGCVSLFEFDPAAASFLAKLRGQMLAMCDEATSADAGAGEDLFRRLTARSHLRRPGQVDIAEFRALVRPLGLDRGMADLAFRYLDREGGKDVGAVVAGDIGWLNRLPFNFEAMLLERSYRPLPKCSATSPYSHSSTSLISGDTTPKGSAGMDNDKSFQEESFDSGSDDDHFCAAFAWNGTPHGPHSINRCAGQVQGSAAAEALAPLEELEPPIAARSSSLDNVFGAAFARDGMPHGPRSTSQGLGQAQDCAAAEAVPPLDELEPPAAAQSTVEAQFIGSPIFKPGHRVRLEMCFDSEESIRWADPPSPLKLLD